MSKTDDFRKQLQIVTRVTVQAFAEMRSKSGRSQVNDEAGPCICLSRCPFQTGKTNLSVASPAQSQQETPVAPVAPLACGLGAA